MDATGRRLAAPALALLLVPACVVVDEPGGSGRQTVEPHSPPPADGPADSREQQMAGAIFDRVNDEREARGLAPVAWNDQLADVAREWSVSMAQTGRLEHQDVRDLLQREELSAFRSLGENIFSATGPVPAGTIHAGWMRSDSHRGNVLNPGWDRLGVGVLCTEEGEVWATQEFGRTAAADRPPVSRETPPAQPLVRPQDDGPSCG